MSEARADEGLLLPGLDGANPLGFLAALGLLRYANGLNPDVRSSWCESGGTWKLKIYGFGDDPEVLLDNLESAIENREELIWQIDRKLPFPTSALREAMAAELEKASVHNRWSLDTLAGFGVDDSSRTDNTFDDTHLRMVRAGDSAGNGLLAYAVRIRNDATRCNLYEALFEAWRHDDENCALRWDPQEDRSYAYRWMNPSSEKTGSVRGGNLLALAALGVLQTIPVRRGAETTGFVAAGSRRYAFTWPLWSCLSSWTAISSLLRLSLPSSLHAEKNVMQQFLDRGVGAIYRCHRIMTSTYYANFTPAQRIA